MERPKLSWFPVSYMSKILVENTATPEQWLKKAKELGFDTTEIYYKFLGHKSLSFVQEIANIASDLGVGFSMLDCSPDFTNPDPEIRRQQKSIMELQVENAHMLKAPIMRITAGQQYLEMPTEESIEWVVDSILELQGFASTLRIKIALENLCSDPFSWDLPGFTCESDIFSKIYNGLENTPIAVSFNCVAPMENGEDPLALLQQVKNDVVHVHAGDWNLDESNYTTAGKGEVPFDDIFKTLAESNFDGYISVVSGTNQSDDDIRSSIEFIRRKIDRYWPA